MGQLCRKLEEDRSLGRIPFWRIPKLARSLNADFTVYHLHQTLAPLWEILLQRRGAKVVSTPLACELAAEISDAAILRENKSLKSDIQKIRRGDFSVEVCHDTNDFLRFLREFRDPYVSAVHGIDALNYRYDASVFSGNSLSESGLILLKILCENEWVAGMVLLDMPGRDPSAALWELGVKGGDLKWVHAGGLAAAYWFGVENLRSRDIETMSLGMTRPFLNSGVFSFKAKYRPKISNFTDRRALIVPNLASSTAREVLAEQPMVSIRKDQLVPLGFRFGTEDRPFEACQAWIHHYRGLGDPEVIDWSGEEAVKRSKARKNDDHLEGIIRPFPRDRCIHHLFEESAAAHLERAAVRYGETELTYRALREHSWQLAHHLHNTGISRGDVVAICASRSLHLPTWVLGVLRSGAAYLPLDPALPRERLHFMLVDAGAKAVVVDATTRNLFDDRPPGCELITGAEVLAAARETPASVEPFASAASDLAYIIYTSGSTGQPKGVAIEHRNLVNLLWDMKERLGLKERETVLSIGSFAFDVTLPDWFWAFLTGGTLIMADEPSVRDPARLAPLIAKHRPSHLQATPGTWEMLLSVGFPRFQPVRLVTTGEHVGEALRTRLRVLSSDVWNLYGPTETTVWSSACALHDDRNRDSIGQPIGNTRFFIVNESGRPVENGESGELWIGGEGVARGYLNRPDLTAERFVSPEWAPDERLYRTGDLVEWAEDGRVRYHGRIDDQVKIRGYRIELGEIDAKLQEHPDIKSSHTLLFSETRFPRLVSFVVTNEATSDGRGWKGFLLRSLPSYMVPSRLIPVPVLPLTPNGKVDRRALRAQLQNTAHTSPSGELNPVERKVAQVWRNLLGIPAVEPNDTFWDLGGDSLSAVQMLLELKQHLKLDIPYERLHANPTLREFCASAGTSSGHSPRLRQVRTGVPEADAILFTHGQNFGNKIDFLEPIAHELEATHPVWGLNGHGVNGERVRFQSLPEMAAEMAENLDAVVTSEGLVVVGYCIGGLLAYELAAQLKARGRAVRSVIMIDTATPRRRLQAIESDRAMTRKILRRELHQNRFRTVWTRGRKRLSHEWKQIPSRFWRFLTPGLARIGMRIPISGRSAYYQRVQERAFLGYEPQPIDLPVHLIKTERDLKKMDYGWRAWCPNLQEHFLEAVHHEALSTEQAPALARLISELMRNPIEAPESFLASVSPTP